ncbi:MAG TPA: spore protease YyaC [Bacillota bacterium]|nr:spore protease YyaC [Bacillota bacterium]
MVRVNGNDPRAPDKIASALICMILQRFDFRQQPARAILCIGSDRSTGDALGPLVGTFLSKMKLPRTLIWGTLAQPVHALNLHNYIQKIKEYSDPLLVIAVDASLGKQDSIGLIEVVDGPLNPGAGVSKQLPPVGHFHLSGIVNLGGFMEQMVLQSTRLYHVMEMARVMAKGLKKTLAAI